MARLFEGYGYLLVSVLSLFLLINFDQLVGTIYGLMIVIDWLAYYQAYDRGAFGIVPIIKKGNNPFISLVWAMGAYVAFIFMVNFIQSSFQPGSFFQSLENVSALISSTFSASPILFGSDFLKLAVWGIFIARIETLFFFRTLLQYGIRSAQFKFIKLPKNLMSLEALGVAAFFGALFALFHLVAKGITNNAALLVTFAFGVFSIYLVFYFKQVAEAIFLHIITNTIATMQQLSIGFFEGGTVAFTMSGLWILTAVIMISWFLLFQKLPLLNGVKLSG